MLTQTVISNAVVATLMALAAAGATKFVRRPQVAYVLWLLVLLKLVTPPIVPLRVHGGWFEDAGRSSSHDAVSPNETDVVGRSPDRPTTRTEGLPLPTVIGSGDPTTTQRDPATTETQPQRIHRLSPLIPFWLIGTIFWLLLAARRTIRFRRILRRATPAAASLRQETRRLAEKFRLKTRPRVFVTEGRVPPLVWPIARRPIVLLPRTLLDELSPSEQTELVAHELAHLRRGDHRIRVLELLILALWWWHPVAWWARRRLRHAEEQCCDAWVLWALPGTAKSYANTLLKTIDFLSDFRPVMPPAACGFHNNSPTVRRFEMILREGMKHKASWRVRIALLVVAAAVLPIALLAGATESGKDAPNGECREEAVGGATDTFTKPREDETSPSAPKRRLMRYDGKDFTWWQQELHTELKAELRVEALKAMGAFGANGYGEEAAAEILRVMKLYDIHSGDVDEGMVYRAADSALRRIGVSAAEPLSTALKSKHKNTRRFAADTLCRFPPSKDILPALIAATKDDDTVVRRGAVLSLQHYGAEAVPAITEALRDKEHDIRYLAARILGSMGSDAKGAVPALISATKDEDRFVRLNALEALSRIQPDPDVVVPTLIERLEDEDRDVQRAAIKYVGEIGPRAKSAARALIKAFSKVDRGDRCRVVGALGEIGSETPEVVMPTLIERVEDEDRGVRQTAVNCLGRMGPRAKQAVPALMKAFPKGDRGDQCVVIRALGEIGPEAKDALPLITQAAKPDSDKDLRRAASIAIEKITK